MDARFLTLAHRVTGSASGAQLVPGFYFRQRRTLCHLPRLEAEGGKLRAFLPESPGSVVFDPRKQRVDMHTLLELESDELRKFRMRVVHGIHGVHVSLELRLQILARDGFAFGGDARCRCVLCERQYDARLQITADQLA